MHRVRTLIGVAVSVATFAASAAGTVPTSAPAISVAQARVDGVRLVVWELAAGAIEAQAFDANTHEPLSERTTLGRQDPAGDTEPVTGSVQTRPAVAGLAGAGGDAVFLVAWHAELMVDGASIGTEIVGQRVFVDDATGAISADRLLRLSDVDDDSNPTSASETRSAPVVVANALEGEFLVLWTHWNGRVLDGDSITHDGYFIYGQEIGKDGTYIGGAYGSTRLDTLEAPLDENGLVARHDRNVIFLAAAPLPDKPGYLLAWSDPAQEDRNSDGVNEDLPQLFTKLLPASLPDRDVDERSVAAQSTSFDFGTGRVALAQLPDEDGFLLAWEDARGRFPLRGQLLDATGTPVSDPVKLLDSTQPGDDAFLSPQLVAVPGEGSLVLYAAVGSHPSFGDVDALVIEPARLVRRLLDPTSEETLEFLTNASVVDTEVADYPPVSLHFAMPMHATGTAPDGNGTVAFTAKTSPAEIVITEYRSEAEPSPTPPPPPTTPPTSIDNDGGGGAVFTLLFLLPFIHPKRTACVLVGGLLCTTTATGAPPDVELLHSEKHGASCYRSVMYREVSEIRLAKSYNKTPIPAGQSIEIVSLPSGWNAEVITERNYQFVKLDPAPFDTVSGISIGRVCLKFPAMKASAESMPYTYDLVATGSPIMATARADDGVSDDELRAMIKRGERLKKGDVLDKPKEIDKTIKTLKRAKDLFN